MPSGWRNSEPVPDAKRQRQTAEQRRHGGHHDGTEAQQAGLDRSLPPAACPSSRSASSAKSIIMMAFFFTMPISRMMPISAMTLKIVAGQAAAPESRPRPPKAAWKES